MGSANQPTNPVHPHCLLKLSGAGFCDIIHSIALFEAVQPIPLKLVQKAATHAPVQPHTPSVFHTSPPTWTTND
jgi:hypothetical protein